MKKRDNMKKLKILYHLPSTETIYANRTIYNGYKNAFQDLGHKFLTLTSNDDLKEILKKEKPDIFITSSHDYYLKFLDLDLIKEYRSNGMVMFTKIDFWNSPLSRFRINEAKSLSKEKEKVRMIKNGLLGDIFFHAVEQDDERIKGFEEETGKKFETILLAADKLIMHHEYAPNFESDIAYIGTNLPEKRRAFKEWLFPLGKKYKLKVYGQDWTLKDKILGMIQKFGQYYNIQFLKKLQKPKLALGDERKIYSSSKICVNIHEEYQRKYGDMNERFFKIMACKGFQITDYVPSMSRYFRPDEVIWVKSRGEWFEKIDYYMNHPEKKKKIIEKGYKKVMKFHTYHNRAMQIIGLYKKFKGK